MIAKIPFAERISAALCFVALMLTTLSLFAGSPKGCMEDFAVLTLNTSRIGAQFVQDLTHADMVRRDSPLAPVFSKATAVHTGMALPKFVTSSHIIQATPSGASTVASVLHSEGQGIAASIRTGLEHGADDVAKALGLSDFYSAHLLNFCEGSFTSNSTASQSSVTKNVSTCSSMAATHYFNPQSILQHQLENSSVTITDLQWPEEITSGFNALQAAQHVTVGLYPFAIGLMVLALALAIAHTVCCSCGLGPFVMMSEWAAVCVLGLAAVMVTVVAVKSGDLVNTYGRDIGISASIGSRFLALTWAAWLIIFVAALL